MSTLTSIGQNVRGKPLLADIKNPFIDKVMNGLKGTVRKDGTFKMITVTNQDEVTVIVDECEQKALIVLQDNKLEEEKKFVRNLREEESPRSFERGED